MHNLTEKLGEISAHGRWPPAEAFIYITKKLKSWHTHKKAPYLDESQAGQVPGLNNKGDFWENQGKDKRTPEERERDRLDDLAATNIVKTFPRGSGLPERYGEGKATSGIMSPPPKLDNKFYNEGYDSAAGARNGQASYNAPGQHRWTRRVNEDHAYTTRTLGASISWNERRRIERLRCQPDKRNQCCVQCFGITTLIGMS